MDPIAIDRDVRRLLPLAILVVGLHAAMLALPVRSAKAYHASGQAGQLQVRLITASALALPAPVPEPLSAPTSLPADARAATPAAPVEPATAVADAVPTPSPAGAAPASASPPVPAFALVSPGGDRDDDYFPRAMLSRAPSPLEPVLIDYPRVESDRGRHVSELTLFIDASGHVARVRVDGAALPSALEDAARKAFTGARFRPGEAEGRAVKSQIRVEVVFDSGAPGKP